MPVAVMNLQANPDWPMLLLVSTTEEPPPALLLGFDARNGKDTWSWTTDPLILIVVLADPKTIQAVYMDIGFVDREKASGTFAAVDEANASALPELLKAIQATRMRSNF